MISSHKKIISFSEDMLLAVIKVENNDIQMEDKFLIYYLSNFDVIDQQSKKNFGKLEIVVGKGEIVNIQDSGIASIKSVDYIKIKDDRASQELQPYENDYIKVEKEFKVPHNKKHSCYAKKI